MEVYTETKYIGGQIVWRGVIKLFKPGSLVGILILLRLFCFCCMFLYDIAPGLTSAISSDPRTLVDHSSVCATTKLIQWGL